MFDKNNVKSIALCFGFCGYWICEIATTSPKKIIWDCQWFRRRKALCLVWKMIKGLLIKTSINPSADRERCKQMRRFMVRKDSVDAWDSSCIRKYKNMCVCEANSSCADSSISCGFSQSSDLPAAAHAEKKHTWYSRASYPHYLWSGLLFFFLLGVSVLRSGLLPACGSCNESLMNKRNNKPFKWALNLRWCLQILPWWRITRRLCITIMKKRTVLCLFIAGYKS